MLGIFGFVIFLWGALSRDPKRIWKKDFHSAKDCWTKGWNFEGNLMLRYIAIIVGGLMLAASLMGTDELIADATPKNDLDMITGIFLVVFLIGWPIGLIIMRRKICHRFEKMKG